MNPFYFPNHKLIDLANLERKKQALAKKADRNANDEDRSPPSLEDLKRRGISRKYFYLSTILCFLPIINPFYFHNHKFIDLANLERKKQALAKKADRNANDEDRAPPSLEDLKRRGIWTI